MNLLTKNWPRDAAIYFLKAFAFGLGSYLLMFVIYGGVRITLFAWIAIVLFAFALAYIPYLILKGRGKG